MDVSKLKDWVLTLLFQQICFLFVSVLWKHTFSYILVLHLYVHMYIVCSIVRLLDLYNRITFIKSHLLEMKNVYFYTLRFKSHLPEMKNACFNTLRFWAWKMLSHFFDDKITIKTFLLFEITSSNWPFSRHFTSLSGLIGCKNIAKNKYINLAVRLFIY